VILLGFVFSKDVILWDLGIVISDNPPNTNIHQPDETLIIKEKQLGVISSPMQASVHKIENNLVSATTAKSQSQSLSETNQPTPSFKNAKQAVLKGKYIEALDIFNLIDANSIQILTWHVTALDRLDKHKEALQLIETSNFMNDKVLFMKGQLLSSAENVPAALDCFRGLVAEYPQSDYLASAKIQISMLEKK
jgi:hypothetical protein